MTEILIRMLQVCDAFSVELYTLAVDVDKGSPGPTRSFPFLRIRKRLLFRCRLSFPQIFPIG